MPDEIEIKSSGEVVSNYLTIGEIEFRTPYPREFVGTWYPVEEEDWQEVALHWEEKAEEAKGLCQYAQDAISQILTDKRNLPDWVSEELTSLRESLS